MMVQRNPTITEEYWDEILKEVIEEKKRPIFTNEIWEKMKDDYGFPETKASLEIKLFNLLREGYINIVLSRKKQAWVFPAGEAMVSLTETKTIDAAIASIFEQLLRIPTLKEIKTETKKDPRVSVDDRLITQRLTQVSHLLNHIDRAIKELLTQERKQPKDMKTNQLSDEEILDTIGDSIEHFDLSVILLFIRTQKKKYMHD